MTKSWDSHLKLLAKTVPQDLVSWLLEGAIYEDEVSPHLNARNIDADILYRVRINNRLCLLHIEFQVKADSLMAERLCEYNMLAVAQNHLPVYSSVVYLKKIKTVAISPYITYGAYEEPIQHFSFQVIKLWEVPTQQLKDLGLKGLLPLLPLTHEGKKQEVVEEMIVALCEGEREERSELLSLAYALSSLLFRSQDEQHWLKWRFSMLDDLLEESWALQEILQKGVKQGMEQGVKQGVKQGMEQGLKRGVKQGIERGLKRGVKQGVKQGIEQGAEQAREQALVLSRHTVLALVEHHAPAVLPIARTKIEGITDLAVLQELILQVSLASHESEVHACFE